MQEVPVQLWTPSLYQPSKSHGHIALEPSYVSYDRCFQHYTGDLSTSQLLSVSQHNHRTWFREREPFWERSHPEVPSWGFLLPDHGSTTCEPMFPQPIQYDIPCSVPSEAPSHIQYDKPVRYSTGGVEESGSLKQNLASKPVAGDEDSDLDSQESDSEDDTLSHKSSHSASRHSRPHPGFMELGKWGNMLFPIPTTLQERPFPCLSQDKKTPEKRCTRAFQSPEHLRRHYNTVHINTKCYFCKVCNKGFPRTDNLRDHYWSHVQRGGRSGRNERMTIKELNAKLGSKEKSLIKRLRKKLEEHQSKNDIKRKP